MLLVNYLSITTVFGQWPELPEPIVGEDGWKRRIVEEEQEDGSIIKYGWSTPNQSAEIPLSEIPEVGSGTVIEYDNIEGLRESDVYSVYVNGREIFTEKFKDVSIARFAFEGEVTVKVVAKQAVNIFNISPHSYGIKGAAKDDSVFFTLSKPGYITVNVDCLERLFLFADPLEQNIPSGENVINVLDMGVDNTGARTETVKIQAAIDMASEIPGGVVYFPDGKYASGSLNLKSNTHIYLESGAYLHCVIDSIEDTVPNIPISDGNTTTMGAFLCAVEAENIKISGRGIIDADGERYRKEDIYRRAVGRMVFFIRSRNIVVEDIILRDSTSWNSHFSHCDDIIYKNVKIINNVTTQTTDGIDIDSSGNVLVDGTFIYSGDDSIVIKATGLYYTKVYNGRNPYNITVRNNVLISKSAAMKIGTETNTERIYGIVFENNDVIAADVAFGLFTHDTGIISDINVINNRCEIVGEGEHPNVHNRPFYFQIKERTPKLPREPSTEITSKSKIKNIYIENFSFERYGSNNSNFMGLDEEHMVEDIIFNNITVEGKPCLSKKDLKLTKNSFVGDVMFNGAWSIYPMEDGYIEINKNTEVTTWINNEHLRVHGSNMGYRVMFLKFEVPEFAARIERATLMLTSNSAPTVPENDTMTIHMVTDNNWDSVANYPTCENGEFTPHIDDAVLATYTFPNTDITYGQAVEIDVKDIINKPGIYTIAIKRSAKSGDLRFFSAEGTTNESRKPQIFLEVNSGVSVDMPVFTNDSDVDIEYLESGLIRGNVEITNNTDEKKQAVLVMVLKKGLTVEDIIFINKEIDSGWTEPLGTEILVPGNVEDYSVEMFVWDSLVNMEPLLKKQELLPE